MGDTLGCIFCIEILPKCLHDYCYLNNYNKTIEPTD